MSINDKDLAAVRAVLDGTVSLEQVAQTYTIRHSVVTAIAILHAVGHTAFYPRGEYSKLLYTLTVSPAIPIEGFPRDSTTGKEIEPEWYDQKWSSEPFMTYARRLYLHVSKGRGNSVSLTHQPLLDKLIQEKGFRDKALKLYKAACARQEKQLSFKDPNRQHSSMVSALKDPTITSVIKINPYSSVKELRAALRAVVRILDEYSPKQR
jgi:hypothetical protein